MDANNECRWFLRPGVWFCCAIALGAFIRFYLVVFTAGTRDVEIWEQHARDVQTSGLIGYYHGDPFANHPPFISQDESVLLRISDASGIPFRILLRAPFALVDLGTTFLLLLLLGKSHWRFVAAAAYWLNPLSIIFSAYHGNTDSAIAFFLLLCIWLLSKEKLLGAAVALGVSLWIKLPGLLAIPALLFFISNWRKRLLFLFIAGLTALSTYLPALIQDAKIVYANVFGYRGLYIYTPGGVPVWGPIRVLVFSIIAPPGQWSEQSRGVFLFLWQQAWHITLALLLLLTWLRRSQPTANAVCATIGMLYTIVYGFSESFAFQYFAWVLPFWLFLNPWFCVAAVILASGYVYSLYWFLCGNPWLLGKWDFAGHAYWPPVVIGFRNLAMLFFFISGCVFLVSAIWRELAPRPKPKRAL